MTIDTTDQLSTVHRILHAADTDVAAFLGFFTDTAFFRMGNSDPVIGREAITAWVAGYLQSVTSVTHHVLTIWQTEAAFAVRMDVTYGMANGESHTLPAMTEIRLEGGSLAHYQIFMDPSPVLAAS
jgi:hypothetical protein